MATVCTGMIEIEIVLKGYHVYKKIWTAALEKIVFCRQEPAQLIYHRN